MSDIDGLINATSADNRTQNDKDVIEAVRILRNIVSKQYQMMLQTIQDAYLMRHTILQEKQTLEIKGEFVLTSGDRDHENSYEENTLLKRMTHDFQKYFRIGHALREFPKSTIFNDWFLENYQSQTSYFSGNELVKFYFWRYVGRLVMHDMAKGIVASFNHVRCKLPYVTAVEFDGINIGMDHHFSCIRIAHPYKITIDFTRTGIDERKRIDKQREREAIRARELKEEERRKEVFYEWREKNVRIKTTRNCFGRKKIVRVYPFIDEMPQSEFSSDVNINNNNNNETPETVEERPPLFSISDEEVLLEMKEFLVPKNTYHDDGL